MAKISARGARVLVQVKASRPDPSTCDKLAHLTLTLTSDGRLLQQVSLKHSPGHWARGNNRIVARVPKDHLAGLAPEGLSALLARRAESAGYQPER
jgi:hypothetical protein